MRGLPVFALVGTFVLFGATAHAEDAPTPVPPPPPPVLAPQPPVAPPPAPTPEESRRVIEQAPASAAPAPAPVYRTMAPPAPTPTDPYTCAPCGPQPCFQRRDACGCRVDDCGNRYGCWDVTVEGSFSSISSPDGILGETIFVPGNQLSWDDVDYDGTIGGRLTVGYRTECLSRLELRGTYYGNPDGSDDEAGFFAARPGDDGLGDISRPVIASYESEAELYGIELNYWTELKCSGRWRWNAGFGLRYLSFEEDASVDFVTTGPGAFPVDNGYVRSEVSNDFIGAQGMLAAHVDVSPCVEVFGSLKAMFGSVNRDIDVSDLDIFAGSTHAASVDDDEFVFGLDFELGVKWSLSKCLALGASYNMLFLDGVQRAEDSFDFGQSNSGAVQARQDPDQLVAHSIFFGVTFTF